MLIFLSYSEFVISPVLARGVNTELSQKQQYLEHLQSQRLIAIRNHADSQKINHLNIEIAKVKLKVNQLND